MDIVGGAGSDGKEEHAYDAGSALTCSLVLVIKKVFPERGDGPECLKDGVYYIYISLGAERSEAVRRS